MPEAFKVKAFRFLEKPVQAQALEEALSGVEQEFLEETIAFVTDYGAEISVHVLDILYIEANKNKTILHLSHGEVETNRTLKHWAEKLSQYFFVRVHKSYLVALSHVRRVDEESVTLTDAGVRVPISRRSVADVRRAFADYTRQYARYM